jgi:hypothetical protein
MLSVSPKLNVSFAGDVVMGTTSSSTSPYLSGSHSQQLWKKQDISNKQMLLLRGIDIQRFF